MNRWMFLSKVNNDSPQIFNNYTNEIFNKLYFLRKNYPDFKEWYYKKVVPDVRCNRREIIVKEVDGEISALSIIKNMKEKKICTFVVFPKYQRSGIGQEMMQISMKVLNTKSPMITVSTECIESFRKLLSKFNFKEYEELNEYYRNESCEYVFNGYLSNLNVYKSA